MARKENKNSKGQTKVRKKTHKNVEVSFYSPKAMDVYVAGEFNGWDTRSLPMKKDKEGFGG